VTVDPAALSGAYPDPAGLLGAYVGGLAVPVVAVLVVQALTRLKRSVRD
jgi:hypothetical protein